MLECRKSISWILGRRWMLTLPILVEWILLVQLIIIYFKYQYMISKLLHCQKKRSLEDSPPGKIPKKERSHQLFVKILNSEKHTEVSSTLPTVFSSHMFDILDKKIWEAISELVPMYSSFVVNKSGVGC